MNNSTTRIGENVARERYEIEFKMSTRGGYYTTYAKSLFDAISGFWVTKDGQFTKASDCYAFILPHMISYILKVGDDT